MKTTRITHPLLVTLVTMAQVGYPASDDAHPDISGKWLIHSSVGGATPIMVHCELQQDGTKLTGSCTPEMANPQPSELSGEVTGTAAKWGYDVMFNGNPGRVDFTATSVSSTALSGTLSLSGTEAPFTAEHE